MLCCLLSGGHCIIKAVPSLAKTLLEKSMSQAAGLKFTRIEFTPDLTPSDITGIFTVGRVREEAEENKFFLKGLIFANVVLADGIDQAPPKTQGMLFAVCQPVLIARV